MSSLIPSQRLLAFIKREESFSPVPYYPIKGDKLTIGYGDTIGVTPNSVTTEEQASVRLQSRLRVVGSLVGHLVVVPLTQFQFDALCDIAYNCGVEALAHSKALGLLNSGDFNGFVEESCDPIKGFVRSGGKVIPGLVNRRQADKEMFLHGAY